MNRIHVCAGARVCVGGGGGGGGARLIIVSMDKILRFTNTLLLL